LTKTKNTPKVVSLFCFECESPRKKHSIVQKQKVKSWVPGCQLKIYKIKKSVPPFIAILTARVPNYDKNVGRIIQEFNQVHTIKNIYATTQSFNYGKSIY